MISTSELQDNCGNITQLDGLDFATIDSGKITPLESPKEFNSIMQLQLHLQTKDSSNHHRDTISKLDNSKMRQMCLPRSKGFKDIESTSII